MYSYRIAATLREQEQVFNLRVFENQRLSVKLGPIVFGFSQDEVMLPNVMMLTQELPTVREDLIGRATNLEPGYQLMLGRRTGIDVVNQRGQEAFSKVRQLGGRALVSTLKQTPELSREHAQIDVVDPWTIRIRDLGSTNTTLVLGDQLEPTALRNRFRVIE